MADATLRRGGMRLTVILAVLLSLCSFIIPLFVLSYGLILLDHVASLSVWLMDVLYYGLYALMLFFVSIPTLFGLYRMSAAMTEGECVGLATVLYAFGSPRRYGRTLTASLVMLLHALPSIALVTVGVILKNQLLASYAAEGAALPLPAVIATVLGWSMLVLCLILALGLLLLLTPVYFIPYYTARGEGTLCAWRQSRKAVRSVRADVIRELITFMLLFAASLLSVGVLTVLYVIPHSLMRYGHYAKSIDETLKGREVHEQ